MHDDTLQSLIALKQRVQLARLTANESDSTSQLAELESLAEATIENLRRLTRDQRPIYLEDLGLVTALEMLVREADSRWAFLYLSLAQASNNGVPLRRN